jgi:hypothetical protein
MRQPGGRPEQHATLGLALGVSYDSAAVMPDGTPRPADRQSGHRLHPVSPARQPRTTRLAAAQQGARVHHRPIRYLLHAPGRRLRPATAAGELGLLLAACTIGPGSDLREEEGTWAQLYGTAPDGAVLIRRDGRVAC